MFRNNKPNGFGILVYKDGTKFQGMFKEGVLHGKGTFVDADGTVIKGEWYDG